MRFWYLIVAIVRRNTKPHSFLSKIEGYSTPRMAFSVRGRPMRAEDTVWIIPMILRNAEEDGMYTVIGDAFVYDNINREVLRYENLSLKEMGGDGFAMSF